MSTAEERVDAALLVLLTITNEAWSDCAYDDMLTQHATLYAELSDIAEKMRNQLRALNPLNDPIPWEV